MVYRSFPLDVRNEAITRVVVVVHGAGRDADNYYRSALAGAFLAGALQTSIVIAPRMASNDGAGCRDTLGPERGQLALQRLAVRRRVAEPAIGDLVRLPRRDPEEGGAQGGVPEPEGDHPDRPLGGRPGDQPVLDDEQGARYARRAGDLRGVEPVQLRVAHQRSARPAPPRGPLQANAPGFIPASGPTLQRSAPWATGAAARPTTSGPTDSRTARGTRPASATSSSPSSSHRGRWSTCWARTTSCRFRGSTARARQWRRVRRRQARGQAYAKYVNEKLGGQHKVTVVIGCGHNGRCIYTSQPWIAVAYPPQ